MKRFLTAGIPSAHLCVSGSGWGTDRVAQTGWHRQGGTGRVAQQDCTPSVTPGGPGGLGSLLCAHPGHGCCDSRLSARSCWLWKNLEKSLMGKMQGRKDTAEQQHLLTFKHFQGLSPQSIFKI